MMGMPMMNMQQMMGMSQGPIAAALERTVFCLTKSLLLKAGFALVRWPSARSFGPCVWH